MHTIAFVTQKGGSGKSTLASSLAVAALQARERVFIIDMDPQQSLMRWSKERGEADIPVEAINPAKLNVTLSALEKSGVSLVIIDTAGAEGAASQTLLKAADLVIIPSRPSVFDLWSSEQTRKMLKAMKSDYAFVLNQCPAAQHSERVEAGMVALEAMGGLLTPLIGQRVDFQDAARYGLGITEFNPSGDAADEMRKLWTSLKRRLSKRPANMRKAA
jgi:chromosome partitioning protein